MKRTKSPVIPSQSTFTLTDSDLDRILPSEGYEILRASDASPPLPHASKRHRITAAGEEVFDLPQDSAASSETALEAKRRRVSHFLTSLLSEPENRRSLSSLLLSEVPKLGLPLVLDEVLRLYLDISLTDVQRHYLVRFLDKLLLKHHNALVPETARLLVTLAPTLLDADAAVRAETAGIIGNLAKAVGLAPMLSALRPDVDHADDYVRLAASKVIGVLGEALGLETVLPFVKALCRSKKSVLAKQTGLRALGQVCVVGNGGVLGFIDDIVELLVEAVTSNVSGVGGAGVQLAGLLAIGSLCEVLASRGVKEEAVGERLVPAVASMARSGRGRTLTAALKTAGPLLKVLDAERAEWLSVEVVEVVKRQLVEGEENQRRAAVGLIARLVFTDQTRWEELTRVFFSAMWGGRVMVGVMVGRNEVVKAVSKLGEFNFSEVVSRLTMAVREGEVGGLAVECLASLKEEGFSSLTARAEEQLVDALVQSFQSLTVETRASDIYFRPQPFVQRVGKVLRELGHIRMLRYSQSVAGSIRWRLNQPSGAGRRLGAELLVETATVLEEGAVRTLGLVVFEFLGEEDSEALTWLLRALVAVLRRLGDAAGAVVRDVVPRVTPILRHRQAAVQEAAVEVLGRCAEAAGDQVGAKEWLRIAAELVDLLRSPRKPLRRATTHCLGAIAKTIGPAEVINPLLNQLKFEERSVKVGAAVGLAVVGKECGAFTLLPALMNEYKSEDLNVRTGVLKAINFMLEMIDLDVANYIFALTPLLEHALIDRDLVHRHTAAWALKHTTLAVVGQGKEDVLAHLLNYLFPNILETAPHITLAFFDAIDALRVGLGAGAILQYLVTGLFHPARRVRDAYWRVYNFLLYSAQHALVPAYPRSLHGDEMELII